MSNNLWLTDADLPKILRFLFDGWRAGLKTGLYYVHSQPAAGAQKSSLMDTTQSAPAAVSPTPTAEEVLACSRANPSACAACSV